LPDLGTPPESSDDIQRPETISLDISPHILGPHVKSVKDILTDCPCFTYDNVNFSCSYCQEFIAIDLVSHKKEFSHNYDFSLGIDFGETLMRREFRNTKSILKRHLETQVHVSACVWKNDQISKFKFAKKASAKAGMTCGRTAFSILHRGLPLTNYTCDILVAGGKYDNLLFMRVEYLFFLVRLLDTIFFCIY
jgi:hypothetical protein